VRPAGEGTTVTLAWIIVAALFACAIAAALAFLASPLALRFAWRNAAERPSAGRVELRLPLGVAKVSLLWARGRTKLRLRVLGVEVRGRARPRAAAEARPTEKRPRPSARAALSFLREHRALAQRIAREAAGAAVELVRHVRLRDLRGKLTIGLEDPAATGASYGWAQAALGVAQARGAPLRLALAPDFCQPGIFGHVAAEVSLPTWAAAKIAVLRGVTVLRAGGARAALRWWRARRTKRGATARSKWARAAPREE